MNKLFSFILFLLIASCASGQVIGRVDKKTKEFTVAPNQKMDYTVTGYEFPNTSTRKMISFSSNEDVIRDNSAKYPLGSYFDTDKMKPGDRIVYLGPAGSFAKMNFISASGKKIVFYLPKSSFAIK